MTVGRVIERLSLDENDCWLWDGAKADGYGQIAVGGKLKRVHRITFEHFRSAIPDGLQLDHLCRVRHCANPWNCEIVTSRENTLRGESLIAKAVRTNRCLRGHEYTPENTIIKHGYRRTCRECKRMRERKS